MRLARIALPRASAICLCACHKCARRVAFRLEPTTTPAQVARRRVDLILIKEAEARGRAVARLFDHADLLHVGGAVWMLAPVTDAMIDVFAGVGADSADLEPETTESDGDDEDHIAAV